MVLERVLHFLPPDWLIVPAPMLGRIIPQNRSKIKCQIAKLWCRVATGGYEIRGALDLVGIFCCFLVDRLVGGGGK